MKLDNLAPRRNSLTERGLSSNNFGLVNTICRVVTSVTQRRSQLLVELLPQGRCFKAFRIGCLDGSDISYQKPKRFLLVLAMRGRIKEQLYISLSATKKRLLPFASQHDEEWKL